MLGYSSEPVFYILPMPKKYPMKKAHKRPKNSSSYMYSKCLISIISETMLTVY